MAWKEYNNDVTIIPEEETSITGREVVLVFIFCALCVLMYRMGYIDGKNDYIDKCPVEILETP